MRYLLDANVLIDAERDYYPLDRVPEFWGWLIDVAEQGHVKVPREVYDEIAQAKDDDLAKWIKANKAPLLEAAEPDVDAVRQVTTRATLPTWRRTSRKHSAPTRCSLPTRSSRPT